MIYTDVGFTIWEVFILENWDKTTDYRNDCKISTPSTPNLSLSMTRFQSVDLFPSLPRTPTEGSVTRNVTYDTKISTYV